MKRIIIVDYGVGNILSISRAIQEVGYKSEFTKEKSKILNSDLLILPGVGAFETGMNLLKQHNLPKTIKYYIDHIILEL